MPPMTVAQAQENLDLVGHDFYMFRNAESGEINVIYERNHKGYGLLQPRQGFEKAHQNGSQAEAISNVTPIAKVS